MSSSLLAGLMTEIDGEGDPIVMVHGLGGSSNTFQSILGALDGYRCIRPDLPGHARSARPVAKITMDLLVQSIVAAAKAAGIERAHFVGHSLGALICQHIAAGHPKLVRSLGLFGAVTEPPDPARQRLRDRGKLAREKGMADVADGVAQASLSAATKRDNTLAIAFIRESHMRQDPEGFAQACEALADAKAAEHRLIKCPTLLVTGDEDGVGPPSMAQILSDRIAGAKVKILERCGHQTPMERPVECGRALAEFLAENRTA